MMVSEAKRQKRLVDSLETEEVNVNVKSMIGTLEKQIMKNQQLRLKYATEPEKFMGSELGLHEMISKFHSIAANPEKYSQLIALDGVPKLLGLLQHENQDISMAVIHLLSELTDPDALIRQDDKASAIQLLEALVENHALELIINQLDQLPEMSSDVEAQAVHHTLEMIENMTELDPSICSKLLSQTKLSQYLLKRVNVKEFDPNKLYASEILSIVYQVDMEATEQLALDPKFDGLDALLQSIAKYRKKQPGSPDEQECVENLVNTLATGLLYLSNQDHFRHLQGFELMFKCLKDQRYLGDCVLRLIDHAVTNNIRNCEYVIQVGGLKYLFGAFMGRIGLTKAGRKAGKTLNEIEKHCVSILSNIALLCRIDAPDEAYQRFHAKFCEKDYEKCDRLVEVFEKYVQIISSVDDMLSTATKRLEDSDQLKTEEDHEDWKAEKLSKRQDAGLSIYHRIAFLIVHVASVSNDIKKYVHGKLREQNLSPETVKGGVEDFMSFLDEQSTPQTEPMNCAHRKRLNELCKAF